MWILMEIGCICAGRQSHLVGMFDELDQAQQVQHELEEKHELPSGGERVFRLFRAGEPNKIDGNYPG